MRYDLMIKPAFPQHVEDAAFRDIEGLTTQQYAAIHLKVPNSGLDWLDDMIRQSLRDDFATKAMQSLLATITEYPDERWREGLAIDAYMVADAMLSARETVK